MKYLIAGLGNIGPDYVNTRHNIGFNILDAMAEASNISFNDKRYGYIAELKYKSRILVLLKPNTYVNRSGLAVNYWLKKEKIPVEKLLVIADDIALPFGSLRLKPSGGDGGHNGLNNIIQVLGIQNFARLRFGIGDDFSRGQQVDYVLGTWDENEKKELPGLIEKSGDIVKSFATIGIEFTMNQFNKK